MSVSFTDERTRENYEMLSSVAIPTYTLQNSNFTFNQIKKEIGYPYK